MRIMPAAKLYVVATPIGNLGDISARALEVLAGADLVAAEDTRKTRVLLSRHGLSPSMITLHEHNEERQTPALVDRLLGGEAVALVSDAGTPLISDPGYRLIARAVEAGIDVVPIPGPSAVTAALSVSGLPTDRFVFEGFLPARSEARLKRLRRLASEQRTLVLFESSHRIEACLADLARIFGADRRLALCRELTKQFETILRGTAGEIHDRVREEPDQRKGEFVLVVEGQSDDRSGGMTDALTLALALKESVGTSQAARIAARIHGVPRRELYRALDSST
ncbi:MAG: 16S rRNA (cytidine(1402)-2'-O)-methyltransferase [Gammaproteobacteria bacterium]|nr:16S rRNA (cytidine(1402)-2'-O)-methyltransferase [Gammaproteobacteria bacterium]